MTAVGDFTAAMVFRWGQSSPFPEPGGARNDPDSLVCLSFQTDYSLFQVPGKVSCFISEAAVSWGQPTESPLLFHS